MLRGSRFDDLRLVKDDLPEVQMYTVQFLYLEHHRLRISMSDSTNIIPLTDLPREPIERSRRHSHTYLTARPLHFCVLRIANPVNHAQTPTVVYI